MPEPHGTVPVTAHTTLLASRVARWVTEVLQPPAVVTGLLLISPAAQPGFPATMAYGALAALFACVIPLLVVIVLVRLGRVTDHHVSDRHQRAPVLVMALGSIFAGLAVLAGLGAPVSVVAMVLTVVGGVAVIAAVSPFWKISGHAAAVSCAVVVTLLMLGQAWLPLLILVPVVGWSRVFLRAHTVPQVVAGSLFGGVVMAGAWWLLQLWLVA